MFGKLVAKIGGRMGGKGGRMNLICSIGQNMANMTFVNTCKR
jgi:hypothetical protein